MFKAFYWMFEKEGIKKEILYIVFSYAKYLILALLLYFSTFFNVPELLKFFVLILSSIIITLPFFLSQGYFFELSEEIICAREEINADNIYNNKVLSNKIFDFPKHDDKKNIWRGFASYVAILIMFVPIFILLGLHFTNIREFSLNNFSVIFLPVLLLYIILLILFPAFMWNYAKNNSIVATLNIFKAINIFGTNTLRYLWNMFLAVINIFIDNIIFTSLWMFVGILTNDYLKPFNIILLGVLLLFFIAKNIYNLFFYAYLLGTIAPTAEA